MTFSLNNYAPGDPRLAQAKLWESAFLEEMKAFQRRTAGTFQVTFMAEVGFGVPGSAEWVPVSPAGLPLPEQPWARLSGSTGLCSLLQGLWEPVGQRGWGVVCPQRSLEDEINRTTAEDLPVFGVSYIIIFLYITLALGSYSSWRRVPVRTARGTGGWPGLAGHPEPSPQWLPKGLCFSEKPPRSRRRAHL